MDYNSCSIISFLLYRLKNYLMKSLKIIYKLLNSVVYAAIAAFLLVFGLDIWGSAVQTKNPIYFLFASAIIYLGAFTVLAGIKELFK
jgi:DNA phosphorothioation-dependent restriction protein DptG